MSLILALLGGFLITAGVFTASSKGNMVKKGYVAPGLVVSGMIASFGAMLPPSREMLIVFYLSTTKLAITLLGASLLAFVLFLINEKKKINKPISDTKNDAWIFVATLIIALGFAAAVYFLVPDLDLGRLGFN